MDDGHLSGGAVTPKIIYQFSDFPRNPRPKGAMSVNTWLVLLNAKGQLVKMYPGISWDWTKAGKTDKVKNIAVVKYTDDLMKMLYEFALLHTNFDPKKFPLK